MSSNTSQLVPLDEYLLDVFSKFLLSKDFAFDRKMSKNYDGSLTLVNYKPMATSVFENSPGYMPFIIQISSPWKKYLWRKYPFKLGYGERGKEKTIPFNEQNIVNIIGGYGFSLYYERISVNVIQGGTNKELDSSIIIYDIEIFFDCRIGGF